MKKKLIIGLLACALLLSRLTTLVLASGCIPACEGCQNCEEGVCVDRDYLCNPCHYCYMGTCMPYGDCGGGCPTCESCVSCWCQCTSQCCQDSDCTLGCHRCSACSCTSRCELFDECEVCIDDECIKCGVLNATHCCVGNLECVPKCVPEGGATCTWTDPQVLDPTCTYLHETDWHCQNPGASCNWTVVEGPGGNATCAPCNPGCDLGSTFCVKLEPKQCRETFIPTVGMVCYCKDAVGLITYSYAGTKDTCP